MLATLCGLLGCSHATYEPPEGGGEGVEVALAPTVAPLLSNTVSFFEEHTPRMQRYCAETKLALNQGPGSSISRTVDFNSGYPTPIVELRSVTRVGPRFEPLWK